MNNNPAESHNKLQNSDDATETNKKKPDQNEMKMKKLFSASLHLPNLSIRRGLTNKSDHYSACCNLPSLLHYLANEQFFARLVELNHLLQEKRNPCYLKKRSPFPAIVQLRNFPKARLRVTLSKTCCWTL